jgi:hypothetical protein
MSPPRLPPYLQLGLMLLKGLCEFPQQGCLLLLPCRSCCYGLGQCRQLLLFGVKFALHILHLPLGLLHKAEMV